MDDMDFLHPVQVGDIAILRARVEWIGRTSLEVGVRVYSEQPATGERHVTLASHMAFVATDDKGIPRPIVAQIAPADSRETAIAEGARARREARRARRALLAAVDAGPASPAGEGAWRFASDRFVFPEDALYGAVMFAGKLLFALDEAAAVLAVRYARAPLATASLDALDFRCPIHVGSIVTLRGALNLVGARSMEIGVEVLAEDPLTGEIRHPCTAYLTFVKLRSAGGDLPPLAAPRSAGAAEARSAAARQAARVARVRRLRESLRSESLW
jgi:acyl-CoA hydrolase